MFKVGEKLRCIESVKSNSDYSITYFIDGKHYEILNVIKNNRNNLIVEMKCERSSIFKFFYGETVSVNKISDVFDINEYFRKKKLEKIIR